MQGIPLFVIASQLAIIAIFIDNQHHGLLFPGEMLKRWGQGVPAIFHGGLWSDLILLPHVGQYLLEHSDPWNLREDWLPISIGIGVAVLNQILCNGMPRSDPLGFAGLKWSWAIVIHFVFMATYVSIIGHFYFHPSNVSPDAVMWVSVLLAIHVAAGTHVFLGVANLYGRWGWSTDLIHDKVLPWMNLGVWGLLFALTIYAGGINVAVGFILKMAPLGAAVWLLVSGWSKKSL